MPRTTTAGTGRGTATTALLPPRTWTPPTWAVSRKAGRGRAMRWAAASPPPGRGRGSTSSCAARSGTLVTTAGRSWSRRRAARRRRKAPVETGPPSSISGCPLLRGREPRDPVGDGRPAHDSPRPGPGDVPGAGKRISIGLTAKRSRFLQLRSSTPGFAPPVPVLKNLLVYSGDAVAKFNRFLG